MQVAVFTESNNWDSPKIKQFGGVQECLFNVYYNRCGSCDISNKVQGISFQKDNQISIIQIEGSINYMNTIDINDKGDFERNFAKSEFIESTETSPSELSSTLELFGSQLDGRDSKIITSISGIIRAISYPHTTNSENRNVKNAGLIIILEKVTGEWEIKNKIYGTMRNQKLGSKQMKFTDDNTLQVVSDQFQFDYLYKRLVSQKLTPNQYTNALYTNKNLTHLKKG